MELERLRGRYISTFNGQTYLFTIIKIHDGDYLCKLYEKHRWALFSKKVYERIFPGEMGYNKMITKLIQNYELTVK